MYSVATTVGASKQEIANPPSLETMLAEETAEKGRLGFLDLPEFTNVREFLHNAANYPPLDSPRARLAVNAVVKFCAIDVGGYLSGNDFLNGIRITPEAVANATMIALTQNRYLKNARVFDGAQVLLSGDLRGVLMNQPSKTSYAPQLQANGT